MAWKASQISRLLKRGHAAIDWESAKVRLLDRWGSTVETVVLHGRERVEAVMLRVPTARGGVNTQVCL